MTTSAPFTTPNTDNLVQPKPSMSRSLKSVGVVSVVAVLLLGSGIAVGAHAVAQSEASPTMTAPSLFVAIKGQRAFDSRVDFPARKLDDPDRPFVIPVNGNETIVPPEAVAVAYTVTVAATEGTGFVWVDPYDGNDGSKISTVAWTEPGQRVVNSGIVKTYDGIIDGGTREAPLIQVGIGGTEAAAHVIIDITGYLIPNT